MIGNHAVKVAAAWCVIATCLYAVEKPTREAIIAYNDQCKTAGVRADFIAKFGGDFAGLDLHGVDFSGPHAVGLESNLRGANFHKAILSDAVFGAAVLDGANFEDTDLRFANFSSASLQHVNLSDARFDDAVIHDSNFAHASGRRVDFARASLSGSDFYCVTLESASFVGVTTERSAAQFRRANLSGAELYHAQLKGANFQDANLSGVNFALASLRGAQFRGANVTGANFAHADITGAGFAGARGITRTRLRELLANLKNRDREESIAKFDPESIAYVESPWFIVCIVVFLASKSLAQHWWRRGQMLPSATLDDRPQRVQFNLAALLMITLLAALMWLAWMSSWRTLYITVMAIAAYLMVDALLNARGAHRYAARVLMVVLGGLAITGLLLTAAWYWTSSQNTNSASTPTEQALVIVGGMIFIMGPLAVMFVALKWAAYEAACSYRAACGMIIWQIGSLIWQACLLERFLAEF